MCGRVVGGLCLCLEGNAELADPSPLCSSALYEVSAGGANGPWRTAVLLASPASLQGAEDGGGWRGWAAGFMSKGPIKQPKNLYPLPGAI